MVEHPADVVNVMVVTPGVTPCTVVLDTPTDGLTVAAPVLLLQLPVVPSVNVIDDPTHTELGPEIGGNTFTDTNTHATLLPQALETIYNTSCTPEAVPVKVVGSVDVLDNVPHTGVPRLNNIHVPPVAVPVNATVPPTHILNGPPDITGAAGTVFTVTTTELEQPVSDEKVTVVVPVVTGVSTPVPAIVATLVLLLVHTPPVQGEVNVMVWPRHTLSGPMIGQTGLTVTVYVEMQPSKEVNVIVTTPAVTPCTSPLQEPTVAVPGLLLLQPQVPLQPLNVMSLPTHTVVGPVIVHGMMGVETTLPVIILVQPVAVFVAFMV